jgi:omega-3 fatty acid desaturase (delta-15 desaturase)
MCSTDKKQAQQGHKAETTAKSLELSAIRKALPTKVFEKSLIKSMYYMAFDLAMWGGSFYLIWTLCHSASWSEMSTIQKAAASVAYWNVAGFFMWCIFVVGHDCGHGTFSNYEILNDILGHVLHGSIMVPFYPWQLSHRRHHMYHNHEEKDYSHPWYTPQKLASGECDIAVWVDKTTWVRMLFPIFGWPLYLFGMPDGSHFIPFKKDRLWKESDVVECYKCVISSIVVVCYAFFILKAFQFNFMEVAYYYVAPLLMFGWWLTAVTYLQHHGPETIVYNDANWTFVKAAFETIDRTFGLGIDNLHHNITDGHVVHHLFFTKIPHYNLSEATRALKKHLNNEGHADVYKHEQTYDFIYRVYLYFYQFGHRAHVMKPLLDTATDKKMM